MTSPEIPQKSPYAYDVEAGKRYAWCACGKSKNQPLCDGSHKGTGMSPVIYTAEGSATVFFCGCKQTKARPLCDGSHDTL